MTKNLIDVTEELYAAKIFILFISLANILIDFFCLYIFLSGGFTMFAVVVGVIMIFNLVFLLIGYRNWRGNKSKSKISLEEENL